jgi:hypothetical protein
MAGSADATSANEAGGFCVSIAELRGLGLMLDEPPLIVRMRGSAGFMGNSFAIQQCEFPL